MDEDLKEVTLKVIVNPNLRGCVTIWEWASP